MVRKRQARSPKPCQCEAPNDAFAEAGACLNTDVVLLAIIAGVPPTILAAAAWYTAWSNGKKQDEAKVKAATDAALTDAKAEAAKVAAEDAKAIIIRTEQGLFELGKAVDGRLKELLQKTEEAAHAAGRQEGVDSERSRGPAKATPKHVAHADDVPELDHVHDVSTGVAVEPSSDK